MSKRGTRNRPVETGLAPSPPRESGKPRLYRKSGSRLTYSPLLLQSEFPCKQTFSSGVQFMRFMSTRKFALHCVWLTMTLASAAAFAQSAGAAHHDVMMGGAWQHCEWLDLYQGWQDRRGRRKRKRARQCHRHRCRRKAPYPGHRRFALAHCSR